ncbi:anhydro-N-acetylmuramic acid kinase [Ancylobacter sp. A5.8]|uniref:anhydro-N-acetylmuramic acid kinase n=1 Tax=Ancylobacter gelatini TaxID=2919920 RepID=UPI001F4E5154|nr:anhydro-N-acetylmuramic acid kinase [Ancylobacter gelatini]MCJ8143260.1 anhydro-N-acetylmuramic acid kinase [Ancylobacter gelatini]
MSAFHKAIGLMSGTSLDGVDVALIETDGEDIRLFGPGRTYVYASETRELLFRAIADAREVTDRNARPGILARAERLSTERHAQALASFLKEFPAYRDVDVIGYHGQTVLHRPEIALTVQIGDGPALARAARGLTTDKTTLVYDMRAADVAAGGQGAPLVPVYHRALARGLGPAQPLLVLNLGGVANISYIDGMRDPIACDTGPANALVDDFVKSRTGLPFDEDGAIAKAGKVDEAAIERLLGHPFFHRSPPKSLDRNDFRGWVEEHGGLAGMSTADGAATLSALTAACVGAVLRFLPARPERMIAAGGGAHNLTLLRMLGERTGIKTETADEVGWSSDDMEAQAFAFLAVRSLRGLPLSFPGTTGVPEPMTGGVIVGNERPVSGSA